jgi:hypothetical protein
MPPMSLFLNLAPSQTETIFRQLENIQQLGEKCIDSN